MAAAFVNKICVADNLGMRVTFLYTDSELSQVVFPMLGASSLQKNGKKNDIVHLSNYPHPPGLIVTAERMTNHIN